MDMRSDVIIVSAYGRGHWLAADLKSQGFSVSLADVTGAMGRWSAEDWEGPFGFYRTENLTTNQLARLTEDCPQERINAGFSVWYKNGLIETRGTVFPHQMSQAGMSMETLRYIEASSQEPGNLPAELWRKTKSQTFSENWLAQLAHSIGSNISSESVAALNFGFPLPILADHYLRRASRDSLKKSLSWCQNLGVHIYSDAKVNDVYLDGRSFGGIELVWEKSGVASGKYLVWCLSSEETQRLSDSIQRLLFPRGFTPCEYIWTRYLFTIKTDYYFDNLPLNLTVIEDLQLPWSGSNLLVIQRSAAKGKLDVWLKIPSSQRFLKPYLEIIGTEISSAITARLPGAEIGLEKYPQDYYYDYGEMGAAPFSIYNDITLSQHTQARIRNIFYDGPEQWSSLGWEGQFNHQGLIRNEILGLRAKEVKVTQ